MSFARMSDFLVGAVLGFLVGAAASAIFFG